MDSSYNFNTFQCNNCGWCCQRSPCVLGIYLGAPLKGQCPFLVEEAGKFFCGPIKKEVDDIKRESFKKLILSGDGCSHKFGPHPISLLKTLLEFGLKVHSPQWKMAMEGTRKEFLQFAQESAEPEDILLALKEFEEFCHEVESHDT